MGKEAGMVEAGIGKAEVGGAGGKVALQQLPAGILGHMGCLQCLVPGDIKYRVILVLSTTPDVLIAHCDSFIPSQKGKRCSEEGE